MIQRATLAFGLSVVMSAAFACKSSKSGDSSLREFPEGQANAPQAGVCTADAANEVQDLREQLERLESGQVYVAGTFPEQGDPLYRTVETQGTEQLSLADGQGGGGGQSAQAKAIRNELAAREAACGLKTQQEVGKDIVNPKIKVTYVPSPSLNVYKMIASIFTKNLQNLLQTYADIGRWQSIINLNSAVLDVKLAASKGTLTAEHMNCIGPWKNYYAIDHAMSVISKDAEQKARYQNNYGFIASIKGWRDFLLEPGYVTTATFDGALFDCDNFARRIYECLSNPKTTPQPRW